MASVRYRPSESRDRTAASETRVRIVCFILLIFLSVVCLSHWGVRHQNPIGQALSFLIAPVKSSVVRWTNQSGDTLFSWQDLMDARSQLEELRRENEHLKKELALLRVIEGENERLKRLHGLDEAQSWDTVPADVIGYGGEQFRTMLLNRGSVHGVRVNQPVITYEGLVGRVMAVQPHACMVLQITDPNSAIGVFAAPIPDEATDEVYVGVVIGNGARGLILEPARGVEVPEGLAVYTSSISTIYPSGLLVGKVQGPLETGYSLQMRHIVESVVNFERLREVLILTGLHRHEAFALQTLEEETAEMPEDATGEPQ